MCPTLHQTGNVPNALAAALAWIGLSPRCVARAATLVIWDTVAAAWVPTSSRRSRWARAWAGVALVSRPASAAAPVNHWRMARLNSPRPLVWNWWAIAVPDSPGQLAGVLASAARAGINVEDVRVEHLPGRPTGVIELLVHLSAQAQARAALAAAGWDVVGG